jgi:hypothetical protein
MTAYLLAFLWGICILLSFVGWGFLLNRVLFPNESVDWGQKASWGIALSIFVGGILNVTSMISPTAVLTYIVLGIFWWILYLIKRKRFYIKKFNPLVVFLVFLLLLVIYGGWVTTYRFNPGDDLQGYFSISPKNAANWDYGRRSI